MSGIRQGEQYAIPFVLRYGGEFVTPENVDDVRIQVQTKLREYSKGELQYSSALNAWLFPLTEEQSMTFKGFIQYQVGIKLGHDIFKSETCSVSIGTSLIKREWDEE